MTRILLVLPGSGAPDVLPLEAWHALTAAARAAVEADPLADRLRELGYEVTALPYRGSDAEARLGLRGRNLLAPHAHGSVSEEARALASRLADLATEHGEIAFIVPDDAVTRAVMERALDGSVEIEVVIGRHPRGHRLLELVKVMARLRGPDGCPWDAEQTHQTLAKHLLDETYELLDAIDGGDDAHLAEELGDLLLQVVFHAQMGTDAGTFDIDDVAQGLVDKLVRRHPHVFADVTVSGADEVVRNWDEIKNTEKQRESALDGVPETLPSLAYAQKLQRRAGSAGFDWSSDEDALRAVREEADELARAAAADVEAEFGDLLFAVAALGRRLGVDGEIALRRAAHRFRDRFLTIERLAKEQGNVLADFSERDLLALWAQAKDGSA